MSFKPEQQIKIESRSPTHQVTSPPHQQMYSPVSPYSDHPQRWIPEMGNLATSLNPFATDMQWQIQPALPAPQYSSPSPMHMQTLSPMGQTSPMGHISPNQMGHISPGLGQMGHMSPAHGGQMRHTAGQGALSPIAMGHASPIDMGHVSPGMQHAPMGHISPGLQHQQQNYQQIGDQQMMDTSTPSISGLLNEGASLPQLGLTSGELSLLSTIDQNLSLATDMPF